MKIFTYIPFLSTGDINTNDVKSFKSYKEAAYHAEHIGYPYYEIIENELEE